MHSGCYDLLERLGIDVKAKIVIARYGRLGGGDQAKVAPGHGQLAAIIYSDPQG